MRFRAVIKKSGDGWIGWLVDLPGVNAQERTEEELIESLRYCRLSGVTIINVILLTIQ